MIRGNSTVKWARKIEVVVPDIAGGYFVPISNETLIDTAREAGEDREWIIESTEVGRSRDKTGLTVTFKVTLPDEVEAPRGTSFAFGIVNANDRHRRLCFYGGLVHDKTGAGVVLTQDPTKKKHTCGLDFKDEVVKAMEFFKLEAGDYRKIVKRLQETELSREEQEGKILLAGRRRLMPWSRLGRVDKTYRKLCHTMPKSAYTLLIAFGKIAHMNPPMEQLRQMYRLRKLVEE